MAMRLMRRHIPLNVARTKIVTATKRLPLWKLSDEMYLNRQLAPSPLQGWKMVKREQSKMIESVRVQQMKDMRSMEREACGFRLEPKYKMGELREGMWVDGRVSGKRENFVMVDIGVYNERGEYIDGSLALGQMRQDGRSVFSENMMDEVYLGEPIRVRIREVVPAARTIKLSLRAQEDLPALFLGKPRTFTRYDLEVGMKIPGFVRRITPVWGYVDVGADCLGSVHIIDHYRPKDRYGFDMNVQCHSSAETAYPVGSKQMFYVKKITDSQLVLSQRAPRFRQPGATDNNKNPMERRKPGDLPDSMMDTPIEKMKWRYDEETKRKQAAEKEEWKPKVLFVDEFLDQAMEPDDAMDSWVAQTEASLFGEAEGEDDDGEDMEEGAGGSFGSWKDGARQDDDDYDQVDEEFADDEFAEDDFVDGDFQSSQGFGKALDGWVLDDEKPGELARKGKGLSENEVEDFFDYDPNEDIGRRR